MNSLTLKLNTDSLLKLMMDFHLLTEIKIALFDASGNEILSYPQTHCTFCQLIRTSETGKWKCETSNKKSFSHCQKTKKLEIYHCHAGLIETTAPLIDNGTIIGYIMFGQVTDILEKKHALAMMRDALKSCGLRPEGIDMTACSVVTKTTAQIQAAAKILEACTFYVLLKDMVSLQRETFIQNLNHFLISHLSEDLSVDRLTTEFHISRTKLYDSCNRYLSVGIAEHVKQLRIRESKRLLKETNLTVHEISDKVGFNDYNYFCRIFKKEVGMPALKYKKEGA